PIPFFKIAIYGTERPSEGRRVCTADRDHRGFVAYRMWPSPVTTYFVEVSSGRPMGPRACSFCVEMPISAPKPNSPPSVNRVEALTITAAASTSATTRRAAACEPVTMASVCPDPYRRMCVTAADSDGTTEAERSMDRYSVP